MRLADAIGVALLEALAEPAFTTSTPTAHGAARHTMTTTAASTTATASTTTPRAELARWETEGGAPSPVTSAGDALLLQRLGEALVSQWHELPTALQRAVYDRAIAGLAADDEAAMKRRMARFLHQHKQPAGST